MQFSKKPILANFGDLPRGEIPEPLKFNRPFCKFIALYSSLTATFVCGIASKSKYLL
jgi:hypothetical protein